MTAKITKIGNPRASRNGDVFFQRLNFQLQDGSFAMTDLVSSFRNFAWWRPVIEAGVGTTIKNVMLKENGKVDADSRVEITQETFKPERPLWVGKPAPAGVQRFNVRSKTNPAEAYVVALLPSGAMECDCKGFQFKKYCSHIDQVKVSML